MCLQLENATGMCLQLECATEMCLQLECATGMCLLQGLIAGTFQLPLHSTEESNKPRLLDEKAASRGRLGDLEMCAHDSKRFWRSHIREGRAYDAGGFWRWSAADAQRYSQHQLACDLQPSCRRFATTMTIGRQNDLGYSTYRVAYLPLLSKSDPHLALTLLAGRPLSASSQALMPRHGVNNVGARAASQRKVESERNSHHSINLRYIKQALQSAQANPPLAGRASEISGPCLVLLVVGGGSAMKTSLDVIEGKSTAPQDAFVLVGDTWHLVM